MKPSDLDDPTPIEPDAETLDRVRARSGAFGRRRRAQRWVSVGTGALVVVLAIAIVIVRGDNGDAPPVGPPSTSTTQPAVTSAGVEGEWRPVSIAGYVGPLTAPPLGTVPTLRFTDQSVLYGNDTCNSFRWDYVLRPDGTIHLGRGGSTLVGCRESPPLQEVLGDTSRVELRDDRLVLLADDGRALAELVRPVVTARIELPSDTMVAGSRMKGRVVVDNQSGHVIPAQGCGSLFAVALSNDVYQPDVAWRLCLQDLPIPMGVSTHPILVSARALSCANNSTPTLDIPQCSPPNTPPALPAGRYEAKLYQSMHVVSDPSPTRIEVVAAS